MPKSYFDGSVWCNVDVALNRVGLFLKNEIEPLGLNLIEWYVLRFLYEQDGQQASQIAKGVGRAATSFTPILDKLEEKSLIERQSHPSDRRAVKVYLTKRGRALEKQVNDSAIKIDQELRTRFSDKDWKGFEQVIIELQTMLPSSG